MLALISAVNATSQIAACSWVPKNVKAKPLYAIFLPSLLIILIILGWYLL